MTKEITAILKSIQKEQEKTRKVTEDIQSDLGTDRQDINNLLKKVGAIEDSFSNLSRDWERFQQKMEEKITKAVEKGVEPATDMAREVAEGLQSGAIPIGEKAAKGIKSSNFVTGFIHKWKSHKLNGDKR